MGSLCIALDLRVHLLKDQNEIFLRILFFV